MSHVLAADPTLPSAGWNRTAAPWRHGGLFGFLSIEMEGKFYVKKHGQVKNHGKNHGFGKFTIEKFYRLGKIYGKTMVNSM